MLGKLTYSQGLRCRHIWRAIILPITAIMFLLESKSLFYKTYSMKMWVGSNSIFGLQIYFLTKENIVTEEKILTKSDLWNKKNRIIDAGVKLLWKYFSYIYSWVSFDIMLIYTK